MQSTSDPRRQSFGRTRSPPVSINSRALGTRHSIHSVTSAKRVTSLVVPSTGSTDSTGPTIRRHTLQPQHSTSNLAPIDTLRASKRLEDGDDTGMAKSPGSVASQEHSSSYQPRTSLLLAAEGIPQTLFRQPERGRDQTSRHSSTSRTTSPAPPIPLRRVSPQLTTLQQGSHALKGNHVLVLSSTRPAGVDHKDPNTGATSAAPNLPSSRLGQSVVDSFSEQSLVSGVSLEESTTERSSSPDHHSVVEAADDAKLPNIEPKVFRGGASTMLTVPTNDAVTSTSRSQSPVPSHTGAESTYSSYSRRMSMGVGGGMAAGNDMAGIETLILGEDGDKGGAGDYPVPIALPGQMPPSLPAPEPGHASTLAPQLQGFVPHILRRHQALDTGNRATRAEGNDLFATAGEEDFGNENRTFLRPRVAHKRGSSFSVVGMHDRTEPLPSIGVARTSTLPINSSARDYGTPEMPRGPINFPYRTPDVLTSSGLHSRFPVHGVTHVAKNLPRGERVPPTGYELLAMQLANAVGGASDVDRARREASGSSAMSSLSEAATATGSAGGGGGGGGPGMTMAAAGTETGTGTGAEKAASRTAEDKPATASAGLVPVYKRFSTLNHRLLLTLQDEIQELEEHLHRLDTNDSQIRRMPDGTILPASRRGTNVATSSRELGAAQNALLARIWEKIVAYNKLLTSFQAMQTMLPRASSAQISAYRAFVNTQSPITELETRFLDAEWDLVRLGGHSATSSSTSTSASAHTPPSPRSSAQASSVVWSRGRHSHHNSRRYRSRGRQDSVSTTPSTSERSSCSRASHKNCSDSEADYASMHRISRRVSQSRHNAAKAPGARTAAHLRRRHHHQQQKQRDDPQTTIIVAGAVIGMFLCLWIFSSLVAVPHRVGGTSGAVDGGSIVWRLPWAIIDTARQAIQIVDNAMRRGSSS